MAKTKLIYIIGSAVIGLISVLAVFFGLMAGGAIDASVTRITIASLDASKEYDGTALVKNEWTMVAGKLEEGHVIQAAFSGSQTDAGESENAFSALVLDEGGADVTDHYDMDLQFGTLSVETKYVEYQAPTAEKVYDGAALTADGFEIVSGGLVEGHITESSVYGELTDVGETETSLTVVIKDGNGVDVSHNYRIALNKGGLKVTPKPVTVLSADDEKVYDGKPLANIQCEVDGETPLVEGHILEAEADGSITDVGTQENGFEPTVKDAEGNDVTKNYEITKKAGTLTITKRFLTLRSKDGSSEYDGKEYKVEEYDVAAGTVADGQIVRDVYTSKPTEVGSWDNEYTVQIFAEDGETEVTDNYALTLAKGLLTITPRVLEITSAGLSRTYDGTPLSLQKHSITNGSLAEGQSEQVRWNGSAQTVVGSCKNEFTCEIYAANGQSVSRNYELTLKSGTLEITKRPIRIGTYSNQGVYSGRPLTAEAFHDAPAPNQSVRVTVNGSQTVVGTSENSFEYEIYAADGVTSVKENYEVTLSVGTLEVTKRAATVTVQNYEKEYDGKTVYGREARRTPYNLASGEGYAHTLEFYSDTELTNVGTKSLAYTCIVRDENGEDVTANYDLTCTTGVTLTVTPRPITVVSNGKTQEYDGVILRVEELTASAGTLVSGHSFEATFTGYQKDAGKSANTFTVAIKNGTEDVTGNYDISYEYGTLEITKRAASVEVENYVREYDGTEYRGENATRTVYGLVDGNGITHTLEFLSDTKRTDAGSDPILYTCIIRDENGADVTKNYDLKCATGASLIINPKPITVVSGDYGRVYDGTALKYEEIVSGEDELVDGHRFVSTFTGAQTDAGKSANTFTVAIKNGTEDVTGNYNITYEYGTLEVTKREATVRLGDLSKPYDGTPLSGATAEVTHDLLIEFGHEPVLENTVSLTDAGERNNEFTCRVEANGVDVTGNYNITYEYGTLEIAKRAASVEVENYVREYDGTEYRGADATRTVYGLVDENGITHTLYFQSETKRTDAGVEPIVYTCTIRDENGEDVTKNYELTCSTGVTLVINPKPITVVSDGKTDVYNGLPLRAEALVTDESVLVSGHGFEASFTGYQKDAGKSANTFTVAIKNGTEDVTGNYDITYEYGTLEVLKRAASVVVESYGKEYDGEPIYAKDAKRTSTGIVNENGIAHELEFYSVTERTDAGYTPIVYTCTIKDENGEDVTKNYELTCSTGANLIIDPKSITVVSGDYGRTYDGTALKYEEIVSGEGELVGGHRFVPTFTGCQTDAGNSENFFTVAVADGARDVTGNYEITYEYGTLSVTPKAITVASGGATKVYDGTALTKHTIASGNSALISGHSFVPTFTGYQKDAGSSDNRFTVTVTDGARDVTKNYEISYGYGTLEVTKRTATVTVRDYGKVYDGTRIYGKDALWSVSGKVEENGIYHTAEFYSDTWLEDVGSVPIAYTCIIRDENGTDVTKNYELISPMAGAMLTVEKKAITVVSGGATKVYDGTELKAETIVSGAELLIGNHKFLPTFPIGLEDVGTAENYFEVTVTNGGTDVTGNYAISYVYGTLEVTPKPITVVSGGATQVYNGLALTEHTIASGKEQLVEGHGFVATFTGAQTDADKSENYFEVTVTDGVRDVTWNYDISYGYGMLEVTPKPITVVSGGATQVYNGLALTDSTIVSGKEELIDGHAFAASFTGKRTDVGTAANRFTVTVTDGTRNVTGNYTIGYEYGTLEVTPKPITVVSGDKTQVYDGTALTEPTIVSGEEQLVEGHSFVTAFTGSRTNAGTADNKFTVTVTDGTKDVTINYEIEYVYGTLEVLKRAATVNLGSLTKVYDGTPLEGKTAEFTNKDLLTGHTPVLDNTVSLTNVGAVKNDYSCRIYADGEDVTENYDLTCSGGFLIVQQRTLAAWSEGKSKEYDGTPLTHDVVYCDEAALVTGHTFKGTALGAITEWSEEGANNVFTYTIKDESGNDVTANYHVETNEGVLKITKRVLRVRSNGKIFSYNGKYQSYDSWTLLGDKTPIDGHTFDAELLAKIKDRGSVPNTIDDWTVVDGEGNDVSYNYDIEKVEMQLIVEKRAITVRSLNAKKTYDGEPLTCDNWEYASTQTVFEDLGEEIEVNVDGSRTDVGESENTIAEVFVKDSEGNDITYNYEITRLHGYLLVEGDQNATANQTNDTGGASGLSADGKIGGGDGENDNVIMLKVYSETDGRVYLRFMSYGDYLGNAWGYATAYGSLLDGKYSMNYLASLALENAGRTAYTLKIDSLQSSYLLPYYTQAAEGDYDVQTSDVIYRGDSTKIYSMQYYPYDYITDGSAAFAAGLPSAYAATESAYRTFVYDNYTSLPATTLSYMKALIAEKGFDGYADEHALIVAVASYIQSSATYSMEYNRDLDAGDVAVNFLETYKKGICQHFATAATALYRALGIPARYVGGYTATAKADTWVAVTGKMAHAWVEVYLDGLGWVPVEVTGGSADSEGGSSDGNTDQGETSNKLVLAPQTQYMLYDGYSTLTADPTKISGLTRLTKLGYTFTATVSGSQSSLGYGESEITSFTLLDPNGADVTDEFEITFRKGVLHVYAVELWLTTDGAEKVYDGTALTADGYTLEGELYDGHEIAVLKPTGSQTDVGTSSNTVSLRIVNENGEDVTYMYKINKTYGTLSVTTLAITVTADSAEKVYDGAPLTCSKYTVTGELPTGHYLEVVITGSQTKVGRNKNKITSVVVRDAEGNDVSENYTIKTENGVLSVTPAEN